MMPNQPIRFQSIVLQPHRIQFVIDELPAIIVCAAGWIYGGMEGRPFTAFAVWVAVLLSLVLLYRLIYLHRTRYYIGSEQIISKHGVLSRKTDYMEQYRIVDFVEHQSFMQQLCGLKTVRIFSTDRNTPQLDLVGIRRNLDVVRLIRERVEYNKLKKGIYEITNH
ncbi:PH domain-containing protein [Bacteroides thetaiotaomicron]|uniref:PH domain-containing protein n=1 Tax=Bacteroides thetaiotaomicron TaxID=818 RepID=UPI001B8D3E05|nr:PH domain-containing protein [Bacteroides thetaiotaomicron]QUT43078.1 Bacterial PH domain protein [Bacteroides thetaiotaomicron]